MFYLEAYSSSCMKPTRIEKYYSTLKYFGKWKNCDNLRTVTEPS
jgi:hypothetical protein